MERAHAGAGRFRRGAAPALPGVLDMIDLTRVLYEQRSIQRDDEEQPHISDLYGCDRATWYRRNGYKPEPFTAEKLAQFAIGLGYEMEVGDTLAAAGYTVTCGEQVEYLGLVGHPDIVVWDKDLPETRNLLIEVKTTDLQKPKTSVSLHYAVQAAAYRAGARHRGCGGPRQTCQDAHRDAVLSQARRLPRNDRGARARDPRPHNARRSHAAGGPERRSRPGAVSIASYRMCPSNPKFDSQAEVDF